MPLSKIRLIPKLSLAALQHGLDKELALWYCLRAINHWGSGRLDLEYAVDALITMLGYSKSTAYRILNDGDGIYWVKRRDDVVNQVEIQIYGLKRVAEYLDTRCGNYFVEIPAEEFGGHKGQRVMRQRAWLYSTFHKPEGVRTAPISRVSIEEATGISKRSQRRYDRIAVKRTANFANERDVNGRMVPIVDRVQGKSNEWLVHKRLGNTYECRAERSTRGMLKKVNTAVTQSFKKGEACFLKRFFTTAKSFVRCRKRAVNSFILVRPIDRLIRGRVEWCRA